MVYASHYTRVLDRQLNIARKHIDNEEQTGGCERVSAELILVGAVFLLHIYQDFQAAERFVLNKSLSFSYFKL